MTLLVVLVTDQALKLLLRRVGSVRMVAGQLWLRRLGGPCGSVTIWCFWIAAAVPLVIISTLLPSSSAFAGLLLGGSLSHAVESSLRGSITDYICLQFWPAFNLADLALAAGALGILCQLLIAAGARVL